MWLRPTRVRFAISSTTLTGFMVTDSGVTVAASFLSVNRALRVFQHVAQIPEKRKSRAYMQFGENKNKFQATWIEKRAKSQFTRANLKKHPCLLKYDLRITFPYSSVTLWPGSVIFALIWYFRWNSAPRTRPSGPPQTKICTMRGTYCHRMYVNRRREDGCSAEN